MTLKIFNTLTGKKELFTPLVPSEVSFYMCGVTVYDYCHIGHARAYVVSDIMRRYLEYKGFRVKFIQNFTDIDDKMIARSKEQGLSCEKLGEHFINAYFEDMDKLYIQRATRYPRATHYIPQMQALITRLVEKGCAYLSEGDVYFSVEKYPKYGQLSKKILDDLIAGSRVKIGELKHNPLDFVLWKASKEGEPFWDSPWGKGRPGWHIECSAMAMTDLGDTIDIHAGGEDLVFPHHENEIAQSECASEHTFVRYWIHNGFVQIRDEKMSKSKNNFVSVRDLLQQYSGEVLRFFLMKTHYRAPIQFSMEGLSEAEHALERLANPFRTEQNHADPIVPSSLQQELETFENRFIQAMDDDFNFAEAIGVLFDLVKFIHKEGAGLALLKKCGRILGLFNQLDTREDLHEDIQSLIAERSQAKQTRDYGRADAIREQLWKVHHILLEDTIDGVRWRKERK